MRRSRVIVVGVAMVVAVALAVLYGGWAPDAVKQVAEEGKLTVMTSFYPLAYLAEGIGGDKVSVVNMTPAGSEPHDFEPSPRQMLSLGTADLFLYNGAGFEPWVTKWQGGAFDRPKRILDMSVALKGRKVNLLEYRGSVDPHVWMDPIIMMEQAEIIRDAFIATDPVHVELYEARTNTLLASLANLNAFFHEGLRACEKSDIVVSHEAFAYLAQAYRISVTSIAGISPDEEPSPKELARITDVVRAKGIKYIFFETTASPKFSETLAREVGAETLALNPLESLTPHELQRGEDYISVMMANLNNIRKALICQ